MTTLLLRAAGRACEERGRNNWVQLQQKLQDTEVCAIRLILMQRAYQHSRPNRGCQRNVWQSPAACLTEKPVERLDEIKKKPGVALTHVVLFSSSGKGKLLPSCKMQPTGQLSVPACHVQLSFLLMAAIVFDYLQK